MFCTTKNHIIGSMWYGLCVMALYLNFSWASNMWELDDTIANSTNKGIANGKLSEGPIKYSLTALPTTPIGKTEVSCFDNTNRTTVEDAEAYLSILSQVGWIYDNVTWSRDLYTIPGHIPVRITQGLTQLIVFQRHDTYGTDAVIMAHYLNVLHDIVKDCILQSKYTGGQAYIGEKRILGIALSGLNRNKV